MKEHPAKIAILAEREIEARVEAAALSAIAKGKRPSDMGRSDYAAIAREAYASSSPAAREQAARAGVARAVSFHLGGIIAEAIWKIGCGWPSSDREALECYHVTTFRGRPFKMTSDAEALECLAIFREDLPELTRAEIVDRCDPALIDRFRALFIGQPKEATIGEIATRNAARGDRVALSFLAWRPQ